MPTQTGRFTVQDMDIVLNVQNPDGSTTNVTVGVATDVSIVMTSNLTVAYTNASHKAQELVSTTKGISFTMNIDYIDNDIIQALFPAGEDINPYFTMVGITRDVDPPRRITLIDCKLASANLSNLTTGGYGRFALSGNALDIRYE